MDTDKKTQVLLALYIEYQKDLPRMRNVTAAALEMDADVFNISLVKLETEGYITGLKAFAADDKRFYGVDTSGVMLTRDGLDRAEHVLEIERAQSSKEKLKRAAVKCGALGLRALKLFAAAALEHIEDVF